MGELGAGSDGGEACGEAWVLVESGFGGGGAGEWVGCCGEEEEACGDVVGVGVEGAEEGGGEGGEARGGSEEEGGSEERGWREEGRRPITGSA